MNEIHDEKLDTGELVIKKGKILNFLDNFWYHYKWHTLIALFLIFTITICTLQMCSKVSYDAYIMYAGGYEIKRTSENGDIPEYDTVTKMLGRVVPDVNGDEEITLSLKDLFVLSDEEIAEIESKDDDYEVHYPLIMENRKILDETMLYSDYYAVFVSPSVYEEYKLVGDVHIFQNLAILNITNEDAAFYDEGAIKLSSLEFYTLPGFSNMPEDTLVCLRTLSAYAEKFGGKSSKEAYETGMKIVENIINYK